MRQLASLIIALSVALGTLAAVTAYHPLLTDINPADGLVLSGPVGRSADDPAKPLFQRGALASPVVLNSERLTAIADSVGGMDSEAAKKLRVPVREFDWSRWSGR